MFAWTGTLTTILMAGYGSSPPLIDGVILTTPGEFSDLRIQFNLSFNLAEMKQPFNASGSGLDAYGC
jgi:hypothetical protein